ncbi:hypothetical protein ES705_08690 [subsurface metagenome]
MPDIFSSPCRLVPLCEVHGKKLKQRVKGHPVAHIFKGNKTEEECWWCKDAEDFEKVMRALMI